MMTNTNERNLYYLDELKDYKVSNNDKDVRGWDVKDSQGESIGEVKNLLISKADKRVVYLDVEVNESMIHEDHKPYAAPADGGTHGFLNKEGENHIIIPVGLIDLDLAHQIVETPKIGRNIFSETKRFKKGFLIDRDYETSILESYSRDNSIHFKREEREDNDTGLYQRKEYQKMFASAY